MSEKQIEQELVRATKARGGLCIKFVSPSFNGMPDRLLILPDEHIGFVEVKDKGQLPRALQLYRHEQLKRLGVAVFVLDSSDEIGGILDALQAT
ncbi:VRR-NUC domain-containing protein [Alloscardovia omnicolens]|uniref:VRR-NUC domain-containing protein n=1 Tax=Alloscardovia omnicolens TaxID=419015 RepID=UPI003A69E01F